MIVAVGEYPPESRIPPIASVNDVKYIRAILNKNGFTDNNIVSLINDKATKAAILDGLSGLANKAKAKDIVVLHFACHGQQIRDQKTIELGKDEDDGYDEALLPYDARARYNPTGYKGEKHLRDDELYVKLIAIRQKIGPEGSMLVLIDACHSGTGTRAESFTVSRGEPVPFPDPNNLLDSVINLSAAEANQGFFENNGDSLSNMVVISGSAPHQENKQVVVNKEELGSLSYAFYKAMSDMPAGNTYGLLFEKIKATIQSYIPDQMPVVEGKIDQVIFSGKYSPKEERTFVRVGTKATPAPVDSFFTIDKGKMDNITDGTVGKIYKAGSKEPFANAVIRKAENFKSIGVADKPMKSSELYELKPDEENYGDLQAGIKLKLDKPVEQQVKELLKPYRFLSLSDNAEFQLSTQNDAGNKKAALTDRNNKLLWSADVTKGDSLSAQDKTEIISNIKKAMRVKYIRTLPDGGDLAQFITVEVIPEKQDGTLGNIVLTEGDVYSIRIRNSSNQKLFYTVLDIYPDGKVEVLYPYRNKEAADYLIDKNASIIRKLSVSKGSPLGTEFLKVIVSKEPMDLRGVFAHTVQRAAMRSFEVMMSDLFNDFNDSKATRADVSGVKVEEIGIVSVHFTIKPKDL